MWIQKINFIFIFLSGLTGLIYQVVWQRVLSQFLGSDSLATSLVLALFFFFTALGYEVLGKKAFLWMKNKFLLYGILEAIIGIYALISPQLFKLIDGLSFGKGLFSQIILSSLLIGFPTFLMGGTLPLLTQGFSNSLKTSSTTHAYLYALNCFGAFIGCLFAGFYLIEHFGLNYSLFFVGKINLLMLPAIYLICKIKKSNSYEGFLPQKKSKKTKTKAQKFSFIPTFLSLFSSKQKSLYLISFLSGFYVFSIENLLIRITTPMIGSSVYSYTMIVACFILALASGALIATFFKKFQKLNFLILFQGLTFLSFYFLYLSLSKWPDLLNRIRFLVIPNEANFIFYWFLVFLLLGALLFIPVCFMGIGLPLLFGFLKNKAQALSPVVGRLYGINALGCALGSLVGGYFLLYFLEVKGVFQMNLYLMSLSFLLINILCFSKKTKPLIFGSFCFAFLLIATFFLPEWDESKMAPGAFTYSLNRKEIHNYSQSMKEKRKNVKIIYSNFGPNTYTHVTESQNNSRTLYVNGKPDANTKSDHSVRSLNILIPILLSKKPEDIFIVGLGTGKSTQIATSFKETKTVEVSEISRSVSQALPYFEKYTQGLKINKKKNSSELQKSSKTLNQDPLNPLPKNQKLLPTNQKWNLLLGDAYRILKLKENKKYDLIVSEPSNPWVTGVEKLFSTEFLFLAKTRLNPEGIYSQWVPLFSMNSETFLKVINNFNFIFPWTYVWATSNSTLLILGTLSPIKISKEKLKDRFNEQKLLFRSVGLLNPFSVLGLQILTPLRTKALTKNYNKWHTQNFPTLAYETGKSKFSNQTADLENLFFLRNLKTNWASFRSSFEKIPKEAKNLIFQNLPYVSLDESFYKSTLHFMKPMNLNHSSSLKFHQNKIKFLFRKNLGLEKSKKYVNEEVFKIYSYLSGLSPKLEKPGPFFNEAKRRKIASVPHSSEKNLLKIEKIIENKAFQWIRIYKNLITMGFPRLWHRLNAIIPKNCSKDLCIKIKKEIEKLKP